MLNIYPWNYGYITHSIKHTKNYGMGDSFSQKKMTLWNGWPIKTWNPEIDKISHDLVWTQKPLVSTCFLTRRDVDSTMENGGFNKTKWFLNMFLSCENHRFHPCWTWFSYVFIQFEHIFLNAAFSQERINQFFPAWLWLGDLTLYG